MNPYKSAAASPSKQNLDRDKFFVYSRATAGGPGVAGLNWVRCALAMDFPQVLAGASAFHMTTRKSGE
jgi:hypothetical protein